MGEPEAPEAEQQDVQISEAAFVGDPKIKLKNTTLTGSPVCQVIGTTAQSFWKTNKGWVDGTGSDAYSAMGAGATVDMVNMTHSGTPPASFAGSARVVEYPQTVDVWEGKGWVAAT